MSEPSEPAGKAQSTINTTTDEANCTNDDGRVEQHQINQFLTELKGKMNPHNDDNVNQYFDTTINYINGVYDKMNRTTDREQTSKEICDDLTDKLHNWCEQNLPNYQANDKQLSDKSGKR